MRKHPGMKKWKAYIDPEMCMGCGTCVVNCPKEGAMSFEVVRPPEHVLGLEDVDIYSY
jgi:NAD-dependent dihydropyrimidine dehydrogenase PreA subunit